MKNPKCPICRKQIELVTCWCSEQPRQVYFCRTCKKHFPLTN